MFCEIKNYVDIEAKRSFQASDAAQFILTLYIFLGSLLLKMSHLNCHGWNWKIWIDCLFFGSLFWLAYLLIISIGKYKNPNIRFFLKLLDFAYFAFLLGTWIWLVVIFAQKQYLGCSDPADMFGIVFLAIGALFALILVFGALAWLWAFVRPADRTNKAALFNDTTDFNPYN